jgi:hypothetical protein
MFVFVGVPTLKRLYQRPIEAPNTTFFWRQCFLGITEILR